jgi:ankyrin repeat protein
MFNSNIDSISSLNSQLCLASYLGEVDAIRQLLDAGAEIDSCNDASSQSAAHIAATSGHIDVIRLLIARHANLNLRDRHHRTPIDIAITMKNAPLVNVLIETNTAISDDVLCVAATVSTDVIQVLLDRGCNVAALRDNQQATPCHIASWHRADAAVIDMLINVAGVNVDARDNAGRTCCHAAAANGNARAMRCFIAAGANVDIADSTGCTPLQDACSCDVAMAECTTLLLAAGANVHHCDITGYTACHKAVLFDAELSLHALLAAGADFDALSNDGMTPRQFAMRWNQTEPSSDELAPARRKIVAAQLVFVRQRASDICVGLQSLDLDALCMCEILLHSCGPVARFVPFHIWWQIATTVKHWRQQ